MPEAKHVRVHTLAKLNLSLEILNKRQDGFHNLRTLFQTIALTDELSIEYEPSTTVAVEIDSEIPDNLITRAALLVLSELNVGARVRFGLRKHIPMGGGLGGGSSDAAAVLLTLPVLAGASLSLDRAIQLAAQIGSDVPFFLVGGTALGLSRGEDLYPVTDVRYNLILATPDLQVATPDAYRSLARTPEYERERNAARDFLLTGDPSYWTNDFEPAVFAANPKLAAIKEKLEAAGVESVRMTGSGSTIFGISPNDAVAARARETLAPVPVHVIQAVNRLRYRAFWWRQLATYAAEGTWPPQPK